MDVIVYHNPRCSKSRQVLALLKERGIEPAIIEYLKTPPSYQEMDAILQAMALEPRELMRKQEAEYLHLQLDKQALPRQVLIEAMIAHPRLIERPIVRVGIRRLLAVRPKLFTFTDRQ